MHATSAPRFRPPGSYLPRTTGRTRAAPNTQIDEAPAARRRSRGPRPNLSIISATRRSGAEGQLTARTSCAAISARYKQHPAARRRAATAADRQPSAARASASTRRPAERPSSSARAAAHTRANAASATSCRRARSDEHLAAVSSGGRSRAEHESAATSGRSGIAASQDQHAATRCGSVPAVDAESPTADRRAPTRRRDRRSPRPARPAARAHGHDAGAVSYTHLTLPTICSV